MNKCIYCGKETKEHLHLQCDCRNNVYIATWQSEGGFGVLKASRNKKLVIKEIVEDVKKYDKKFNEEMVEDILRSNDYYRGEVCEYQIESSDYSEL